MSKTFAEWFSKLVSQDDPAPKKSETEEKPHIVFIGGGNMADAIITGTLKKGFLTKEQISVSVKSKESADRWKAKGFDVYTNNLDVIVKFPSAVIVLCVKPHLRSTVYDSIKSMGLGKTPLVISIMAGIKLFVLRQELSALDYPHAHCSCIVRLMPNTPCAIGQGCFTMSSEKESSETAKGLSRALAEAVGVCVEVDEKYFNGAAAIAGSGPAWMYMFVEALADGGVLAGCPRAIAMKLASHTLLGAARMVQESGEHPGVLKDRVCSPGGTTVSGLRTLEKAGFRSAVIEAVKAASDKADTMVKMPFLLVTGYPASGKSTIVGRVVEYFKEKGMEVVVVKDDDSSTFSRAHYKDSIREKDERSFLRSMVQKSLSKNTIVICDSLNYIKAKTSKTTFAVLYCIASEDTSRWLNSQKNEMERYDESLISELVMRYEKPEPKNRWDSPLFEVQVGKMDRSELGVASEDMSLDLDHPAPRHAEVPLEDIYNWLCKGVALKENASTVSDPLAPTNFLHELDRATQEVVATIVASQQRCSTGQMIVVPTAEEGANQVIYHKFRSLPELTRLRRQFVSFSKTHPIDSPAKIASLFINFLNTTQSVTT